MKTAGRAFARFRGAPTDHLETHVMHRGEGSDGGKQVRSSSDPSIFEYIRNRPPPAGSALDPFRERLPDEPEHEPGHIGIASGLVDEIGIDEDGEQTAASCFQALAAVAQHPSRKRFEQFVELVGSKRLPTFIDPFIARVAAAPALSRRRVHRIARRLTTEGRERTTVKVGIALLGLTGTQTDVDVLMTLGRHPEFTSWVGASLARLLDDPEPQLWELARTTCGWGQIAMIRQLASTERPQIRSWILREGITFWTETKVAYLAATSCRLVEELRTEVPDEPLWQGAGRILESLIECRGYRNRPDIDDYLDGPEAIRLYVRHAARAEPSLEAFRHLATVVDYLEVRRPLYHTDRWDAAEPQPPARWSAHDRRVTALSARWTLRQPHWAQLVDESLESDEEGTFYHAELAARWRGDETMPRILEHLRRHPTHDSVWFRAAMVADDRWWDSVLDAALDRLELPEDRIDQYSLPWWRGIAQEMERFPGRGWHVLKAALMNEERGHRAFGLSGLDVFGTEHWPAGAEAAVQVVAETDPDDDLRKWARRLLADRRRTVDLIDPSAGGLVSSDP
jgi:hypothetical protein